MNSSVSWRLRGSNVAWLFALTKATRGTDVILHLRPNEDDLLSGARLRDILRKDLGSACGAPIGVEMLLPGDFPNERIEELDGELIDGIDAEIRDYRPNPEHLVVGRTSAEETLVSNLLKTNCPLTGQPDWASIQLRYEGPRIDREGLLKYLVSFRQHGGFHEHCTESIFMDLMHRCRPERLTVYARYTRRGGLDINPFRTNCNEKLPRNVRTARQ